STYLALTFGTLLSSQGTVASFVLTLSGFPPGFPSVLRFRLYQIFPIRFPRCFPGSRFRGFLSGGSDFIRCFRLFDQPSNSDSSGWLAGIDVPWSL
ncbi:hypothetical protein, partial [Streptomyces sp. NPDC014006]|uniref:hypothetical protein n=1 Tax=Streptomyces sp. NPDC014006 TaxID=3364870 RepID=UPI0036F744DA